MKTKCCEECGKKAIWVSLNGYVCDVCFESQKKMGEIYRGEK